MMILRKSGGLTVRLRQAGTSCAALWRSKRGATAIFVATALPMLILIAGMSVNRSYLNMRNSLLRRTTQAAALAAGQYLSTYYTTGSSATITSKAQATAAWNMPTAQYGTVVTAANVVLGTWNSSTKTFTPTTTNPSAVQVTGLNTAANGNAVQSIIGTPFGPSTVDISSSAIVSYGTGKAFNTIILNDLSMSFSHEIADQRAADIAILNCVAGAASTTSRIGLTAFTGHSSALYPLGNAVTNQSALTTYINNTLNYCGSRSMPACSGSNVAAGLYSAITQLQAAGLANSSANIILITDGVPNADAITYTRADGTYPTPTSSSPVCSTHCTDANLWTMAQDQATYANTLGINISTVYYSGDTTGQSNQAAYAADLRTLVTGTGIALVAPTAPQIDTAFGSFCASMGSALKMVN